MAKKKTTKKKARKKRSPSGNTVPAHFAARQRALRAKVEDQGGLDASLITNAADIRYLTGYPGDDAYLLINADGLYFFSDFRYEEDLEPYKKWANVIMREKSLAQEVGALVGDLKLKKVGLQADHLRVQERDDLARAIGKSKVRNTTGLLTDLRAIKDEVEVRLIRKAVRIAQEALSATLNTLETGQSEREICARLEYEMKMRGAEAAGFPPIVAAQANGSKPHYSPGAKVTLLKGQPLLIDWGARVEGYTSDLTRTFGYGSMPPKVEEIYKIVLEAQRAAINAIMPGMELRTIDAAARDVIKNAGYGERFGHGLGHGIGLDVHESPGLSWRAKKGDVLKEGMVVTVEPGIYLPGIGGVRIEDDVLVTEKGHRVLSNFPKDLKSTVI